MTDDARRELVRAAFHELGHAIVDRQLGIPVRRIDLTPSDSARATTLLDSSSTGLGAFELAVARITGLLAGEPAELLRPGHLSGRFREIDDDEEQARQLAARIAGLPSDEATDYAAMHAEPFHPGETDDDYAACWAKEAGGQEQHFLRAFCAARARRMVAENAALITALAPSLTHDRIWTGDELEQAIAALSE